jgi:UDP-N-acetylglucosamine--dolichyl-phosphate N-acetylglucosaminephosphotransferase
MTIVAPREISFWKLGAALLPVIAAVGVPATLHPVHYDPVYASVVCSTIAFAVTIYTIPKLGPSFVKVGLKGRDLLKKSTDDVSVNDPHSLPLSTRLTRLH